MPARPASTTFTPSKKHVRFLEACLDEASQGKMGFRLGAVVVKNGKIIGRGKNSVIRCVDCSLTVCRRAGEDKKVGGEKEKEAGWKRGSALPGQRCVVVSFDTF
jgi:deoxycytidylate deaminase